MPDAHTAVLVVSGCAAGGKKDDKGGPSAEAWLRSVLTTPARITLPGKPSTIATSLTAVFRVGPIALT